MKTNVAVIMVLMGVLFLYPVSVGFADNGVDGEFEKKCGQLLEEEKYDQLILSAKACMDKKPGYAPAYRFWVLGNHYGKKDAAQVKTVLEGLLKDKQAAACSHYALGYLYYINKDLDQSEKEPRQAIAIDPNIALAQNNLGAVLSAKGKLDEALVHIKKALQLEPGLEVAQNNLKNVLVKKNPPDKVESVEKYVIQILTALSNQDMEHAKRIGEVNLPLIRENRLETIQVCSGLLHESVKKELAGKEGLETLYFLLATILAESYNKALSNSYLLDKAAVFRGWKKEEKETYLEAYALFEQGEAFAKEYKYDDARDSYNKSMALYQGIGYKEGAADCLLYLGDVHQALYETSTALQRYEKALAIFRAIKDRLGEANTLQSLGDVHRALSETSFAVQRYEEALAIFRSIKSRLGEANTLQSLGHIHRDLSQHDRAEYHYRQALEIQTDIMDRYGMLRSYIGLGLTYEQRNIPALAAENYKHSIRLVEEVWTEMKIEEMKTGFFSSNVLPYEALIRLLFKIGKGQEAFSYAERSKARSLLYLLGNKRIDPKRGAPLKLNREEKELRQQINTLTTRISIERKKEKSKRASTQSMDQQLLQLKQKHNQVMQKIKLFSPEYASLKTVNPLSPEEIQGMIPGDRSTVLIEYYITHDALYLWLLDGKDIYPFKTNITGRELAAQVQNYRTQLTNLSFGVSSLKRQSNKLYHLLLKPLDAHLTGVTTIGIIPHGILHYLPFETLMKGDTFLAEQDKKIFYLPSGSVYKYCRDKNPLQKKQLIAFGNPDGTLPFTIEEIAELKRLYPKDTEIFIGSKANEDNARYYSPYCDILHFACHGGFNAGHPLYSALELVKDANNDGRLEVHEIFQLELKPAYLVTLSACDTHLGSISPGDEMVGLTRALIYAGTPSILASLWKVDDYYTAKLMISFYRHLKEKNKLDALLEARKEIMALPGKRHPYYWAAFVLIGDYR